MRCLRCAGAPIEAEAEVVRLVYERYTVGHLSIGAITRLLNERGVPTSKQGAPWESLAEQQPTARGPAIRA